MRDAFGGLTNIIIIVVFITILSGYLAFNVTYVRAFKVKNYVIDQFERYAGSCTQPGTCQDKIDDYIQRVGYSPNARGTGSVISGNNMTVSCRNDTECGCRNGYCYQKICDQVDTSEVIKDRTNICYYRIVTRMYIDIPIINNIMPDLRIFDITGSTMKVKE